MEHRDRRSKTNESYTDEETLQETKRKQRSNPKKAEHHKDRSKNESLESRRKLQEKKKTQGQNRWGSQTQVRRWRKGKSLKSEKLDFFYRCRKPTGYQTKTCHLNNRGGMHVSHVLCTNFFLSFMRHKCPTPFFFTNLQPGRYRPSQNYSRFIYSR